jgi:hypothetical protein
MAIDAQQLAGGQQAAPAPQEQAPQQAPRIAPNAPTQGIDRGAVMGALKNAVAQAVDEQGFVDMQAIIMNWAQVAQEAGIPEVSLEMVFQLINENPELVREIVEELGLAGVIANGQRITGEQLADLGQGGSGQSGAQQGGF